MTAWHTPFRLISTVVAGVALVVGVAVFVRWYKNPVIVHVINRSAGRLDAVVLTTTDETLRDTSIPPGGFWTVSVHPVQESGIDMRYRDSNGQSCGGNIDIYMERGSRGTVDIEVFGCKDFKFKSDVTGTVF
jgi:hypothetical protein